MSKPPRQTMTSEQHDGAGPPRGFPVQLHYGRRRFCSARVRNLSVQDAALTLRNLTLPTGTLVRLEFAGLGPDRVAEAVVVDSAGTHVSVMFQEPQPELLRAYIEGALGRGMEPEIGLLDPPPRRSARPQLARP
jgi:hypothetical protein